MSEKLLFTVNNHHGESCGPPPAIDDAAGAPPTYRGYFENEHGEQAIFLFDWETKTPTLYLGDAGWKPVVGLGKINNVCMSHSEARWLAACMLAVGLVEPATP